MATTADVPLLIASDNSSSERRISPSWSIATLKGRLETITGIPASSQKLTIRIGSQPAQPIEAADEETTVLAAWPLQAYAEIRVTDTRPPGLRPNYTDTSAVEKYSMSTTDYESRSDSVLAWKKAQKLGRFDPNAPSIEQQRIDESFREVDDRGIRIHTRCRLLPESDHRRGAISFIGLIPEITGTTGAWVGVTLDEPTGKNDGSVKGARYFTCAANRGVFVRAERVECGDFPELGLDDDDLMDDDDEEF